MAKAKAPARTPAVDVARTPPSSSSSQPLTMEERLHRIETMRIRIDGYIQFMGTIAQLPGTSSEIKERAVTVFYEQMLLVERQLGRIHDEFRLE